MRSVSIIGFEVDAVGGAALLLSDFASGTSLGTFCGTGID